MALNETLKNMRPWQRGVAEGVTGAALWFAVGLVLATLTGKRSGAVLFAACLYGLVRGVYEWRRHARA